MILDYSLAAIVTAGVLVYLTYALLRPERFCGGTIAMSFLGWIQIVLCCVIIVALVKPLGWYMTRVFNGERTFLTPVLRPVERLLYAAAGVDERQEQHWLAYTVAMLI